MPAPNKMPQSADIIKPPTSGLKRPAMRKMTRKPQRAYGR